MGNVDSKASDGHIYSKMTPDEYRRYQAYLKDQSAQSIQIGNTPPRSTNHPMASHVPPLPPASATGRAAASVRPPATAAGRASVAGQPTAAGQAYVAGQPTAAGRASVAGQPTAAGRASVAGQPTAAGQAYVAGQPTAAGRASVAGQPTAAGQAYVAGQPTAASQLPTSGRLSTTSSSQPPGSVCPPVLQRRRASRKTYDDLCSERHYETNTPNYQPQPRMKPNLQQKHAMSDMKHDYESICQQRQSESNRQYLHTMQQHGNDTSDFHERDFQRRQQELDITRKQMQTEPSTERTGEYRRILDKFSRETDPYILLEVSRDTPTREVTRKYRRLARQVHPDRGGNREDFDRLTKAYLCILEEGKRKETEAEQASHQNMQQHFGEYADDQSTGVAPLGEGSEFNHELFHKIYRENRLDDPYDTGYSSWIKETGNGSTDIEPIFSDGFNLKVFNAAFREKKELASHQKETKIVEYTEPSAALQTTGVSYTELGQDDVGNFTKQKHDSSGQLAYCDYKEAMTDTHLIDPTQIKSTRTEYRDLEHCEKDRESISYTMTKEDRQQHQYLRNREEVHEVNRKDRLHARDQKIKTKYNQVHTQLTGDTPNYMLQS